VKFMQFAKARSRPLLHRDKRDAGATKTVDPLQVHGKFGTALSRPPVHKMGSLDRIGGTGSTCTKVQLALSQSFAHASARHKFPAYNRCKGPWPNQHRSERTP
jgi:hypothetical protein